LEFKKDIKLSILFILKKNNLSFFVKNFYSEWFLRKGGKRKNTAIKGKFFSRFY